MKQELPNFVLINEHSKLEKISLNQETLQALCALTKICYTDLMKNIFNIFNGDEKQHVLVVVVVC